MNYLRIVKIISAIILLSSFISCKEDEVPEEYMRSGNTLAFSPDGNLVVAGYNTGSAGYDATILLANPANGDTIWKKTYGGSYVDAFFSVKPANKGGFIATGFSNRGVGSSPGMFVVITDNAGKSVSSNIIGGTNLSQGFSVIPHANSDSGYLVAGYVLKTGRADRDIYVVKLNNDGSVKWDKNYGPAGREVSDTTHDAAYSICAAPGGGYFLTGSYKGYNNGSGRIFLMKISEKGDSLWTKSYGYGIGYSIVRTLDGNLAIGGSLQTSSVDDIFILKTDTSGKVLWKQSYPASGYEFGAGMVQCTDGGYAITGITTSKGYGNDDIYLLKTNAYGEKAWDNYYGGDNVDQGFGLVQNANQDFFITGFSNTGGSFIFLNKTDNSGKQIWVKNYK